MHFEDLNSVVGQEVGNNEGPVIEITVVAEDFAVMVEELFLGKNFASSEFLLHVLEHLGIFLGGDRNFRHLKVVNGAILCWWLGRAEFLYKGWNNKQSIAKKRSENLNWVEKFISEPY